MILRIAGVVLAASALVSPAAGQDGPLLRGRVDTTEIHVGDPVRLLIAVDHPQGSTVAWPDSLDVAPFEVLSVAVDEPETTDGALRSVARVTLTSFELGELELPSIEVAVRGADGSEATLATDRFVIGVVSVGVDPSGEIREIKGPLAIPRNWWLVALWILLVLAALAGARYVLSRRRRRPVVKPPPPPPPRRPFGELAHEALDALERSSLLEQGRVKEFHIRLSEVVRSYIEGQLGVPAREMTTGEVVAGLRKAALGPDICASFQRFLDRCDLVKFAKHRPSDDEALALLADGRTLVDRTSGQAGRKQPEISDSVDEPEVGVLAGADGEAAS